MSCPVFGGRPEQCVGEDSDKSNLVDKRIQGAMGGVEDACAGMKCIVACAQKLDCYDAAVNKACRYLSAKTGQDRCPIVCGPAPAAALEGNGSIAASDFDPFGAARPEQRPPWQKGGHQELVVE